MKKKEDKVFKSTLFNDILKENNGKFSQGRVYLLWSIVAYYITLIILTIHGINKTEIEVSSFEIIVDALQYAMTLFAGYVFGSKAIEVAKIFKGSKDDDRYPRHGGYRGNDRYDRYDRYGGNNRYYRPEQSPEEPMEEPMEDNDMGNQDYPSDADNV